MTKKKKKKKQATKSNQSQNQKSKWIVPEVRSYDSPLCASEIEMIDAILDEDSLSVNERLALALSCGANAPGGGGFQKGNSCAKTLNNQAFDENSEIGELIKKRDWIVENIREHTSGNQIENDVELVQTEGSKRDNDNFMKLENKLNELLEDYDVSLDQARASMISQMRS